MMIFIFLTTVYSIGVELKDGTARKWILLADNSIFKAVMGKLLPQTAIFFVLGHILQLSSVGGYEISLPLWNYGNARYDISFYPCFAGLFRGFPHRFNPQFPFCNVHVVSVGYRKHFHVGLHVPP